MQISIKKEDSLPLFRQIYQQISLAIRAGHIKGGERLPSSRDLADQLQLSRKPVLEAYELLTAEGYLESRMGAGSYVIEGLEFDLPGDKEISITPVGFSPYRRDLIDFRSGMPDMNHLPLSEWKRTSNRILDRASALDFSYQEPQGREELCKEICRYLSLQRGLNCSPEQVLITSGTTQAIGIVTQLLRQPGRPAVIEDPLTKDIPLIIKSEQSEVLSLPMDDKGIMLSALKKNITPSFLYTTPSHQYPLGYQMPVKRRLQWIERAQSCGFYIVEDDYDSEFRYQGPPISTFCSLAPQQVLYIGTFSKTLFPGLRTAYLILPFHLIETARQAKWMTDLHNQPLTQLTLASFMKEGLYQRHIRRMKKIYRAKRDSLYKALIEYLPGETEIYGLHTGIHGVVRIPGYSFSSSWLTRLEEKGIKVYPLWEHSSEKDRFRDGLILGFGMLSEDQITRGIAILGSALREGISRK